MYGSSRVSTGPNVTQQALQAAHPRGLLAGGCTCSGDGSAATEFMRFDNFFMDTVPWGLLDRGLKFDGRGGVDVTGVLNDPAAGDASVAVLGEGLGRTNSVYTAAVEHLPEAIAGDAQATKRLATIPPKHEDFHATASMASRPPPE